MVQSDSWELQTIRQSRALGDETEVADLNAWVIKLVIITMSQSLFYWQWVFNIQETQKVQRIRYHFPTIFVA